MKDNVEILLVEKTKIQEFLNINALPSHLRTIWIAAYFLKKLGRQEVATVDLLVSSQQIIALMKKQNLNLRMSGGLLIGIINLYIKQLNFFVQDCSTLLKRLMINAPQDALVVKRSCTVTKRVLRHGSKKTLKIKRRKPNTGEHLFNTGFLPKKFTLNCSTSQRYLNSIHECFDSMSGFRLISSRLDKNGLPKELGSTVCDEMEQNDIALNTSTLERYSNLETLSLECYPKGALSLTHSSDNKMEPLISCQSTNWENKSNSESKWLEDVDDTLQSEGQDFSLRDLGIISEGGDEGLQKITALNSHTTALVTDPSKIEHFHEIETLRAVASPYSMLSVTRDPLLHDPHTSITCLTAQRQRFSINDLNSGHTSADDDNSLRFSLDTSEPMFRTPYVHTLFPKHSTIIPVSQTPYHNLSLNPINNNSSSMSLSRLEKQNINWDDAEDHWTIILSDLDESEQIDLQAASSQRSFVRRHQMGASSKKLDSCVQLDPKQKYQCYNRVLKEWQTFSLPLLRPFHTNHQRDVDNTSFYRHNLFPLFVPKHAINYNTNLSLENTMSYTPNGYNMEWNQATPASSKEKVLSGKADLNYHDIPMLSAHDLMLSPSSPTDVSVSNFEPVHGSGSFSNGTLALSVHSGLNNDGIMTDLFKALYDKDNIIQNATETSKLSEITKTPLKTPLKRYVEFYNVASPRSNVSLESRDVATTVNGENTSVCDSYSASSFSLHALSPEATFTQTPIGEHHQDTKETFNDKKNTPLPLLQVFETPVHAPGNKFYNKKNMLTPSIQIDTAFTTTLFHYASASESIKMALCREVGFCKRTIRLLEHISYRLVQTKDKFSSLETQPCITFDNLVESQSRTTVAATFFELLTLKTRMFIDIKQENTTRKNHLLITFGERYKELTTETSL